MADELELMEEFEALDGDPDVDADEPTPEVLAELAAVAEAEASAAEAMESELEAARDALDAERAAMQSRGRRSAPRPAAPRGRTRSRGRRRVR